MTTINLEEYALAFLFRGPKDKEGIPHKSNPPPKVFCHGKQIGLLTWFEARAKESSVFPELRFEFCNGIALSDLSPNVKASLDASLERINKALPWAHTVSPRDPESVAMFVEKRSEILRALDEGATSIRPLSILLSQEEPHWVAQCIEHDMVGQGATIALALTALEEVLRSHLQEDKKEGRKALAQLPPAPSFLRERYNNIERVQKGIVIVDKPHAFTFEIKIVPRTIS